MKRTNCTSRITHHPIVCLIGLGYVGLPLAEAFAGEFKVIGFDIDTEKINRSISWQFGSLGVGWVTLCKILTPLKGKDKGEGEYGECL